MKKMLLTAAMLSLAFNSGTAFAARTCATPKSGIATVTLGNVKMTANSAPTLPNLTIEIGSGFCFFSANRSKSTAPYIEYSTISAISYLSDAPCSSTKINAGIKFPKYQSLAGRVPIKTSGGSEVNYDFEFITYSGDVGLAQFCVDKVTGTFGQGYSDIWNRQPPYIDPQDIR